MFNIVMIGPQGSGKGTQSEKLAGRLGLPAISVGGLMRAEAAQQTGLGREIAKYLGNGELIPSDIVRQVVEVRLGEPDTVKGEIMDGYPRTVEQAGHLDEILAALGRQVSHVIYLELTDEKAVERLSGRLTCSNRRCGANYHLTLHPSRLPWICDRCGGTVAPREDDTPAAIRHRLELFRRNSQGLLDLYGSRGLLKKINGDREIGEVSREIFEYLGLS